MLYWIFSRACYIAERGAEKVRETTLPPDLPRTKTSAPNTYSWRQANQGNKHALNKRTLHTEQGLRWIIREYTNNKRPTDRNSIYAQEAQVYRRFKPRPSEFESLCPMSQYLHALLVNLKPTRIPADDDCVGVSDFRKKYAVFLHIWNGV